MPMWELTPPFQFVRSLTLSPWGLSMWMLLVSNVLHAFGGGLLLAHMLKHLHCPWCLCPHHTRPALLVKRSLPSLFGRHCLVQVSIPKLSLDSGALVRVATDQWFLARTCSAGLSSPWISSTLSEMRVEPSFGLLPSFGDLVKLRGDLWCGQGSLSRIGGICICFCWVSDPCFGAYSALVWLANPFPFLEDGERVWHTPIGALVLACTKFRVQAGKYLTMIVNILKIPTAAMNTLKIHYQLWPTVGFSGYSWSWLDFTSQPAP